MLVLLGAPWKASSELGLWGVRREDALLGARASGEGEECEEPISRCPTAQAQLRLNWSGKFTLIEWY